MDFKEFLDKYVLKASHPLTENAKKREEAMRDMAIECYIKGSDDAIILQQKISNNMKELPKDN